MRSFKKDLEDFKEAYTVCGWCGGCYYHGPLVPHNWLELPPVEWSNPHRRCPSYEYFKFRAFTAQGRGNLARSVFEDENFPITDDLIKIVYTCTSCGTCQLTCPLFEPLTAIWALREELVTERMIQPPEPLNRINENIEKYNNRFGAKKAPKILEGVPAAGENLFFAGCTARFDKRESAIAAISILKAAGLDVACLGEHEKCCGFIPGHDGYSVLLEKQAERNLDSLEKAGAKQVIVSCAHCYKALKIDYPLIFGKLPFEVMHFAEVLARLIDEKKVKFRKMVDKDITYHDPCFLGRHIGVYEEPRKVLSSIPGIRLVEMDRNRKWAWCCGSGAKITSSCYPEFAEAVTRERLEEGKKAADIIVTACTECFSHMDKVAKKAGIKIVIYDLPILVAAALGKMGASVEKASKKHWK
ncbi:MAG: (Fe-S)-binding protein [Candidatus Bathyarchaeia archaeon]